MCNAHQAAKDTAKRFSNRPLYQTLQDQNLALPESVLDIMVRIMFATATMPSNVIDGQLFRPQ